uniref:Uncharacterized protein n=1 Tax=Tanacetum cinerariifolium TaxID=118510 RepID=A0A6L2LEB6_TANCI|nr:hypothetical protein [Tanacetum cinerariifolium]
MFYKKNIDYVYLLWEDLLFQIENKEAKNTNKMPYPRFTKIIVDYLMSKDQSISRRNKMIWHTARDDTMFTAMICIFRQEDTQVYGTILPKELTNQAILESKAYKTYYAFASGEKTLKPKYVQKKVNSNTSPKQKPVQATKDKGTGTIQGFPVYPNMILKVIKSLRDIVEKKKTIIMIVMKMIVTEHEEEDVDERVHTPLDYELTDDEKIHDEENINDKEMMGGSCQQNLSQESEFEQEKEDAYVTLTPVLDIQKADEPVPSSFVSFDFTSKLLNVKNPSLVKNEITSLMDTTTRHATAVPKITSSFTTTIPPFFNPLLQQATPTPAPITSEATTSFTFLLDFLSIFRFNYRVTNLEKDMSEIKQVDHIRFVNPMIEKNVTESLFKFELTKILLEKIEENKSHLRADYKKKLYDALVESYNTDKDLFNSYDEVFTLKRSQDDIDKDQDPFAGLDQGTKRRKLSKEAESYKDSRKSAHAEEQSHTVDDSGVQQDQEFNTGNNDEQPADKEVSKEDWLKRPE